MTLQEILVGIKLTLEAQWPGVQVYPLRQPQKFARPAFMLEGGPITDREIGGGHMQVNAQVHLVCFTPVDAYGNSTENELLETVESLRQLFQGGYIQVGERCPHVLEITTDYGYDYVEVTAKLEFYDPSVARGSIGNDVPLMQHVHTRLNEE